MANGVGLGGLALGVVGTIGKLFGAGKANDRLKDLESQDPSYVSSPYAAERLGLAKTLLNSRMPGSTTIDNGIRSSQSNTIDAFRRGSTDSSQFLAGAAGTQGVANDAYQQEGLNQNQYVQNNLQNLNSAETGMINEGDKVAQDRVRQFDDKAQIQGQINQNNQNVWGSIADGGFSLANAGMNGGFSSLFGKKAAADPNGGLNPYTQRITTPVY